MSDMLDEIDEMFADGGDDDNLVITEDGEVVTDAEESGFELDEQSMSEAQAREVTDAIRSTITATYVLLQRAYTGKAYQALGYETWKAYINGEFDFSVQRSYQLLDLARTVDAIEAAAPEGYDASSITEAQARDIKRELPKITERITEETAGHTAEESEDIVQDIIEETRTDAKEQKKADEQKKAQEEEEARQAHYDALENAADDLLDSAQGGLSEDDDEDDSTPAPASHDESATPRDPKMIYNFFTMLSTVETLPDAKVMASLIPDSEHGNVLRQLNDMKAWLSEFEEEFNAM